MIQSFITAATCLVVSFSVLPAEAAAAADREAIKAYCLDFNWAPTGRRGKPFAKPGMWADADPAEHVAWYRAMGANVIQTFCVSTNGYAWYKGGVVPEQPGLKHDFLPEVVKLGHAEGMRVFGYFCISSNPRWAELHPEQSYGSPTTYHIPFTDEYLAFLSESIADAVKKTGIDGFMIDWVWMPNRKATDGKWLDCEKALYKQLMGGDFPGEDKLTKEQDTAYSRKAIDRCWKAIRKAAKEADPECLIWLTVNNMHHPHVVDSDMYKECDWVMNEAGSVEAIEKVRPMVGKHTQLITCLAVWNGQDASATVPKALDAGVGLYGFTTPRTKQGLVPLDRIFEQQVGELSGDDKNIAVLARAYQGKSAHAEWKDGRFVEATDPPSFRLSLRGRGRGMQDTFRLDRDDNGPLVTIITRYGSGSGKFELTGDSWPVPLRIRLCKGPDVAAESEVLRISAAETGYIIPLSGDAGMVEGKPIKPLQLGRIEDEFLKATRSAGKASVVRDKGFIEVGVPAALLKPAVREFAFDWGTPKK